jgi:dihydroorotate dehydrogenase (fumarate)
MPLIGTGGVVNGVDAFEHVLCGASAVQIGTVLVEEGVDVFGRLETELASQLSKKGYSKLEDCLGKLKEL